MTIALFYHSLLSDWNHGNAHFLRGIASELIQRGHIVRIFEPTNGWSLSNLIRLYGQEPLQTFHEIYPELESTKYDLESLDLDYALEGCDLIIVHEWNDHELVRRIGEHRKLRTGYRLLFHDTHHRSVTEPSSMASYDLSAYDGVLAFGEAIRRIYLENDWIENAWTWHEAADVRIFHPKESTTKEGDLVWIGNWGDEERTAELHEFLLQPVQRLGLKARTYGVRYPDHAIKALADAGIDYAGWLPNFRVPDVFSRFKATVHVPRRPYVEALPGIPTIRPFEALACGIPLVCSPWFDLEQLFTPGKDYLIAHDGGEMVMLLRAVTRDHELAHELAEHGRRTILNRHTCSHRVDELLDIYASIGSQPVVENRVE